MASSRTDSFSNNYDSIDSVLKGLEYIANNQLRIEDDFVLFGILNNICRREKWESSLDKLDIKTIIALLKNLEPENRQEEDAILKKEKEVIQQNEKTNNESYVPTAIVKELLEEYDSLLKSGLTTEEITNKLSHNYNLNRQNIETFIRKQGNLYQETLEQIKSNDEENRLSSEQQENLAKKFTAKKIVIDNQQNQNLGTKTYKEEANTKYLPIDLKERNLTEKNKEEKKEYSKIGALSDKLLQAVNIIARSKTSEENNYKEEKKETAQEESQPSETKKYEEKNKQQPSVELDNLDEFKNDIDNSLSEFKANEEEIKINVEIPAEFENKSKDLAKKLVETLKEDNQLKDIITNKEQELSSAAQEVFNNQIVDNDCFEESETNNLYNKITNILKDENNSELTDKIQTTLKTQIKTVNVDLDKWININQDKVTDLRGKILDNKIEQVFSQNNPKLDPLFHSSINEYKSLVKSLYFNDKNIDRFKSEAFSYATSRGISPGQIKNAWTDLNGLSSVLRMKPTEFNKLLNNYKNVKKQLKDVKLPYEIGEVRSFEGLMRLIDESDEAKNLLNLAQKFIANYENIDKFTGGFLTKIGVKKVGTIVVEKLGGQAMNEFVKESLAVVAEKGTQKGIWAILKGVLSGGVKAGATKAGAAAGASAAAGTTAAVGTAASGGAAGAVAAFQAVPVVGQIILVVAAAVAVIAPIVKKIKEFTKSIFESIGFDISSVSLGTKKFFKENLGNFMGGIANFGFNVGVFLVGIPTVLGTISLTAIVLPVVIFVIIGLMGYQTLTGNMISSLVPPVATGEEANGDPGNNNPGVPPIGNPIVGGECNVEQYVYRMKQCSGWSQTMPDGDSMCKSGCGVVSTAMVLRSYNSIYTPDYLMTMPNTPFTAANGSYSAASWTSIKKAFQIVLGDNSTSGMYYRCTNQDISNWICAGKVVMVVAQFRNSRGGTSGHYILAVAVKNGQIYSADPAYSESTPFDGGTTVGHIKMEPRGMDCLVINTDQI